MRTSVVHSVVIEGVLEDKSVTNVSTTRKDRFYEILSINYINKRKITVPS